MTPHTSRTKFVDVNSTISELRKRFLVDPVHSNRDQIMIRCPSCPDRKYHLGLSFSKNLFSCFRCPFRGFLTDFLKSYGIKFRTEKQIEVPEIQSEALRLKFPEDITKNYDIIKASNDYMENRGFDLNFLKNFNFWPITDKSNFYYGYLIFYINDYAFYARRFLDFPYGKYFPNHFEGQKHIIRKSDKEMKLFYAYEKNNSNTILVVESMFNLIKAAQFGYDSVCIFGKKKWAGLVAYLESKAINHEVCLCFDKDVALEGVEDFVKRLKINKKIFELSYVDPNDMTCNDIAEIKNKNILIKVINKRKKVNNIFINTFNLEGVAQ